MTTHTPAMVLSENEHLHADMVSVFPRVSVSAVCFQNKFPQKERYKNDQCACVSLVQSAFGSN